MNELIFSGVVQSCFVAAFLATKHGRTLNDTVLAAWMIFMALPLLSGISGRLLHDLPLLRSNLIYPLTYGPFLWLYVETLTGHVWRLRPVYLLHFAPFAFVSFYQILFGWVPDMPNPIAGTFDAPVRGIGAANLALLLAYTLAIIRRLRLHGREVVEHFSELSSGITLVWLYWITLGVCGVYLLLFLGSALSMPILLEVHIAAVFALILLLSFFGLRQRQVFDRQEISDEAPEGAAARSIEPEAATAPEPSEPRGPPTEETGNGAAARYSRSGLTKQRAAQIARRLDTCMQAERPYLDADLTIEKLAKRMAVPRHHLTQVISERHGKNFYLFVNEYRIEAVKRALKAPECAEQTLLDIAYASGFNSKSTFNTAFKRLTGMTPSQYRQQTS